MVRGSSPTVTMLILILSLLILVFIKKNYMVLKHIVYSQIMHNMKLVPCSVLRKSKVRWFFLHSAQTIMEKVLERFLVNSGKYHPLPRFNVKNADVFYRLPECLNIDLWGKGKDNS